MIDIKNASEELRAQAKLREDCKKTPAADCGDGVYRQRYDNAEPSDFEALAKSLTETYGEASFEREVRGNRFLGVRAGKGYYYLTYYPERRSMSLYFAEEGELLFGQLAEEGIGIAAEPTVIQFCPTDPLDGPHNTGNFGMCYLFDLGGGHFLIYDGLADRHEDDERIYSAIKNATPEGLRPVIDAWIFTHGHFDHVAGARKLILKHKDDIEVRNFIMNMPDPSRYMLSQVRECIDCYIKWLPDIFSCYPDAKIWKAHAGQSFSVGDANVEVLYTHEDHPDERLVKFNDSSLVTRVDYGKKSFFFPADVETEAASRWIHDVWGEYLKSDFYQVAHHAWEAYALEYYYDVDPKYILLPIRNKHWHSEKCWSFPPSAVLKEEYNSGKRKFYATVSEDHVIRLGELD